MSAPFENAGSVAAWVADRLEEDGILYAIGGALALGAHGIPRMTDDVGFSVFVPEAELDRLFDSIERAGCLLARDRARADARRIHLFYGRCGRVGLDFFVSFHPHHHESLARRVPLPGPDGRDRWFLSAEDLAIHKLALFRSKDQGDLDHLFAVRGATMDVDYIRRWLRAICADGDPRRSPWRTSYVASPPCEAWCAGRRRFARGAGASCTAASCRPHPRARVVGACPLGREAGLAARTSRTHESRAHAARGRCRAFDRAS